MYRIIFFLALYGFWQPAFARDVRDGGTEFFEEDGQKVKSQYRQCSQDSDCTYSGGGCESYRAVNASSKLDIDKVIKHWNSFENCLAFIKDIPIAHCIKSLCEIVSDDAK